MCWSWGCASQITAPVCTAGLNSRACPYMPPGGGQSQVQDMRKGPSSHLPATPPHKPRLPTAGPSHLQICAPEHRGDSPAPRIPPARPGPVDQFPPPLFLPAAPPSGCSCTSLRSALALGWPFPSLSLLGHCPSTLGATEKSLYILHLLFKLTA